MWSYPIYARLGNDNSLIFYKLIDHGCMIEIIVFSVRRLLYLDLGRKERNDIDLGPCERNEEEWMQN